MDEMRTKLLERGIVVLPDEIEHETYEYVLEAVTLHPGPLAMYCAGDGGDSSCAMAVVDLIRQHGQVVGLLAGEAASNHATIWAGCPQRYVFPHGRIAVHQVAWGSLKQRTDSNTLFRWATSFEATDEEISGILAAASNKETQWWYATLQAAGSGGIFEFDAKTIIDMEMGKAISEWGGLPMEQTKRSDGAEAGSWKIPEDLASQIPSWAKRLVLRPMPDGTAYIEFLDTE